MTKSSPKGRAFHNYGSALITAAKVDAASINRKISSKTA
jgi:hypothetical protein